MDIQKIVNAISNLPYFERRVFISNRIKPKLSRFIYKYRSINPNSETSTNRLRDILVGSKLWLSSSSNFNDPFDMSANFTVSRDVIEKRHRFKSLAKEHGLKHKDREKYVDKMMLIPHDKLEERFKLIFEKNVRNAGVYSFAGDPRSILMWSHYANDHQGICIQFEIARDIETLSHALPVRYSIEYPTVDWVSNFQESLIEVMLRKHQEWEYEKELRIVLPDYANKYLVFDPASISGIIFGCRAGNNIKKVVSDLLEERINRGMPPVKLYQAVQHKNQYKLILQSHA